MVKRRNLSIGMNGGAGETAVYSTSLLLVDFLTWNSELQQCMFIKASGPGVMGLLHFSHVTKVFGFIRERQHRYPHFTQKPMLREVKATQQPGTRSPGFHPGHSHTQTGRHELQDTCLASITTALFSQCFCQVREQAGS